MMAGGGGGLGGAGLGGAGLGGAGLGGAGLGGMGAPAAADNRPAEERFATQLEQLRNMGFPDTPSNLQALQMANGDINEAINSLLSG
mmetsp:Transcript_4748/g.13842  ORF Transcript_4748/g.13842 Transcript_4748/m.13842 type:complete len:87 (-) Transcript_4748:84-344(-)